MKGPYWYSGCSNFEDVVDSYEGSFKDRKVSNSDDRSGEELLRSRGTPTSGTSRAGARTICRIDRIRLQMTGLAESNERTFLVFGVQQLRRLRGQLRRQFQGSESFEFR
ncbi:hypothetical protein L3Y34_008903 [Caenorhabditis briggsae]|uniref:Uncharacterized protein n=1 Tax=Caenorhabditis briggsae TaxID=6238 RepID=A0AAE9A8S8_CAEBR|nr:hypothetical protein L3Y34_008903 [Caenorhabditis briggsae]